MDLSTVPDLIRESLLIIVICMGAALIGAIALLVLAARQITELDIPEDADFFTTLQSVPITVPLALDLLDLAFDIFAAPISWIILEFLGLQALQMITVFEGLVPGTQLIPTLTIAWFISKGMKNKKPTKTRSALEQYQLERQQRVGELSAQSQSRADRYRRMALPDPFDREDIVEGEYYEEDLDEPPPDFFEEEDFW